LLNLYVSNNNLELVLKKQTCLTLFMDEQLDFCYMANIIDVVSHNKVLVPFDSASVLLEKLFYIENLEVLLQIKNIIFKAIISLSSDQAKVLVKIKEKTGQLDLLLDPVFMT